jgi:hypothetical protein
LTASHNEQRTDEDDSCLLKHFRTFSSAFLDVQHALRQPQTLPQITKPARALEYSVLSPGGPPRPRMQKEKRPAWRIDAYSGTRRVVVLQDSEGARWRFGLAANSLRRYRAGQALEISVKSTNDGAERETP